jgi:hypothetical protein
MTIQPRAPRTTSIPTTSMIAGSSSQFDSRSIIAILITTTLQHLFVDHQF